jgi:hypothetical protein
MKSNTNVVGMEFMGHGTKANHPIDPPHNIKPPLPQTYIRVYMSWFIDI